MKMAVFSSICLVLYLLYCGNEVVGADSTSDSSTDQQSHTGQVQTAGQVTQPFWATRGRRGGERSPLSFDDDLGGPSQIEDYGTFKYGDRSRVARARMYSDAVNPCWFSQLNPDSRLTIQDINNMKDEGRAESVFKMRRIPAETYLPPVKDGGYYFWSNMKKNSNPPTPSPELPFWAARG